MFKKRPEIKNLSPLRSSDRRKLADQIIKDYDIPIPSSSEPAPTGEASSSSSPPASLSSLRSSLLPDSTSSARFTTTSGPNQTLLVGTLYVGAHPGQEERILWFQAGKAARMLPTVYTLWQNPGVVPLLHTPDFVVDQKLAHGSDLMIPGLVKPRGAAWDARATKGAVVAVAGLQRDTVPMWVGTCDVDVTRLGSDLRGQRGVAVKGLHWAGDEGWQGLAEDMTGAIKDMKLDEDDADADADADGGGVALSDNAASADPQQSRANDLAEVVDVPEPTTKEVDDAFIQAFLFSVHKAKADNSGPYFGFDFPLQPSFLISSMIQPYLRHQSPHYNIKKTSWKNAKKFIKHLDKMQLLKPYPLPKPKTSNADAAGESKPSAPDGADPSVGQKITIQVLYRASAKLVPTLLPSKTDFYSGAQIAAAVKTYIEQRPDLGGQGASSVKLDPFLANTVLNADASPQDSPHAADDRRALAAGRILRGALQRRVVDDPKLCQPFYSMMRGDNPSSDQQQPKPKSGAPPLIHLSIEKRTGTKVVTKITGLEPFFIDPQLVAPELQRKCAGAASVGQLTGGRPGLLEVVVQGDQRKIVVGDVLARRGIDARWVDVVDKTKGKKK
ncbi:uncharacterized protein PG998_002881 [Apiospora kogelbergensis]|uniref:uncharacterized protein n=1 Tax=Apiospora kogelbergensis TaxID=1337665 RepID=UPI00312D3EC9